MFVAAALLIGAALIVGYLRRPRPEARPRPPLPSAVPVAPVRELHVPHVQGPLKIDGELEEPSWRSSARVVFETQDGREAHPYSDARFMWGEGMLHVGLYAADHDIVTAHVAADGPVWLADSFHVVFSSGRADKLQHAFDVGPTGVLTDGERHGTGPWSYAWQSGAKLACDADGTIDTPGDNDEEWVVEMDVPLASLGLEGKPGERIEAIAHRCDVREAGQPPLESPCPQAPSLELVFDP